MLIMNTSIYLTDKEKRKLKNQFLSIHNKIDFEKSLFTIKESIRHYAASLFMLIGEDVNGVGECRSWLTGIFHHNEKPLIVYVVLPNTDNICALRESHDYTYDLSCPVTTIFIDTDFLKETSTMNYISDLMEEYIKNRYHITF